VHGSPHMHQWLVDGVRLGLIDFDRFALGEPEFDLATFLAELDTERRLQTPVAAIEAALIQGFESAGIGIDAKRIGLYRVYKHIAILKRRARAVRPDAAARAERHLRAVEDRLAQM
jgi:aminoglycoside phosphotransferase (APT) family kinase protein